MRRKTLAHKFEKAAKSPGGGRSPKLDQELSYQVWYDIFAILLSLSFDEVAEDAAALRIAYLLLALQ